MSDDAYSVLGVSPSASPEEIKVAYRALAQIFHPDRYEGTSSAVQDTARVRMQAVNEAFRVLSASRATSSSARGSTGSRGPQQTPAERQASQAAAEHQAEEEAAERQARRDAYERQMQRQKIVDAQDAIRNSRISELVKLLREHRKRGRGFGFLWLLLTPFTFPCLTAIIFQPFEETPESLLLFSYITAPVVLLFVLARYRQVRRRMYRIEMMEGGVGFSEKIVRSFGRRFCFLLTGSL